MTIMMWITILIMAEMKIVSSSDESYSSRNNGNMIMILFIWTPYEITELRTQNNRQTITQQNNRQKKNRNKQSKTKNRQTPVQSSETAQQDSLAVKQAINAIRQSAGMSKATPLALCIKLTLSVLHPCCFSRIFIFLLFYFSSFYHYWFLTSLGACNEMRLQTRGRENTGK